MNSKSKVVGAAAALLSLGAVKACSKVAFFATRTGTETAAGIGLTHAAPTALHAIESGAGDTGALARSTLHQTDALGASAHTVGDAAGSSSDDVSRGVSQGATTHEADHESSFLHEAGHRALEESLKQMTEPRRDSSEDNSYDANR